MNFDKRNLETEDKDKLDIEELSKKIEAIKAERERTANALKRYEEELERRKQEVPFGVPIEITKPTKVFAVDAGGEDRFLIADPKEEFDKPLCDMLNTFSSRLSAQKHAEMLLAWRKALVANAKGEPIDIKALLPLLPKGWVVMSQSKNWLWFENKPYISVMDLWSSCIEKDGHKEYVDAEIIRPFNIKPVKDWRLSMMECGLC